MEVYLVRFAVEGLLNLVYCLRFIKLSLQVHDGGGSVIWQFENVVVMDI